MNPSSQQGNYKAVDGYDTSPICCRWQKFGFRGGVLCLFIIIFYVRREMTMSAPVEYTLFVVSALLAIGGGCCLKRTRGRLELYSVMAWYSQA